MPSGAPRRRARASGSPPRSSCRATKRCIDGWAWDGWEAMPADKYGYKPTTEISSFGEQLVHVAGITQRFIDTAKGVKTEAPHHTAATKPEIIDLLKKTFHSAQEMINPLTDAQLMEPVKLPFGDRTVTRATFWQGPLYQIRNHHGQLVVYLRMNGIVPPTTARR